MYQNRTLRNLIGGILILASQSSAQIVKALPGVPSSRTQKTQAVAARRAMAASRQRGLVSYSGDTVFPQFVDGATWKTSLTMTNLDSKTLHFILYFIADDGSDLFVQIVGLGVTSGVDVTLNSLASTTIETTGTASQLSQGYVWMKKDNIDDVINGIGVFRARTPGHPDFEAAVPLSSEVDNRFVLLFDNTAGFVTGVAVANSWDTALPVHVTIRDEAANVIGAETLQMAAFEHTAFQAPLKWTVTRGIRGSIEFSTPVGTTALAPSVLGLRFNPSGPFTSFHVLSNLQWLQ